MNENQVLQSVGRSGWRITGRRPETRKVQKADPTGAVITTEEETGNTVWDIASADGRQVDSITVKPGRIHPDDPLPSTWTVVQGPSKEVPAESTSGTTPAAVNEAALNDERSWNAQNTKWGRVTHAEKRALELREQTEQRQLTNQERDDVLARAREDRAIRAEERSAANQAASNDIARARLALDQQKAMQGDVQMVRGEDGSTLLVRVKPDGTSQVVFSMPAGIKVERSSDGTLIAYNPANPSETQVIYQPEKPPELVPGQTATSRTLVQRDPRTGALTAVDNPAYIPPVQQRWQELQDGINAIQAAWTRGEITPQQAQQYKDALQQNFNAALLGTTPFQQFQDRQNRAQQRMQSGQSMLNQRVSSGSGLAQSLLSGAGALAQGIMDPTAFAGFSPFAGAMDYVTQLGGGPDVYGAAADAVRSGLGGDQNDPAMALLNAALSAGAGGGGMPTVPLPPAPDPTLLPPGQAGTLPPGDPRYMGTPPTDPAGMLLAAALGGRPPQQFDENALRQRGPLFG